MGELAVGLANDKDSLTTRVAYTLGLTGPEPTACRATAPPRWSRSARRPPAWPTSSATWRSAGGVERARAAPGRLPVPARAASHRRTASAGPSTRPAWAAPVGSGVGVVALRRLADALADGDRIYAVIRGWAVNNDGGRKVGFTAPGVQGQAAVIAEALSSAGPRAPPTSTTSRRTAPAPRSATPPSWPRCSRSFRGRGTCLIGSVKTNVGHLDRAAGVTGLIKTALALRHERAAADPQLHRRPTRSCARGEADLQVVDRACATGRATATAPPGRRQLLRHRRHQRPRRAGGGAARRQATVRAPRARSCWSGRRGTAAAADAVTGRLAEHLAPRRPTRDLADVAYTLQTGRRGLRAPPDRRRRHRGTRRAAGLRGRRPVLPGADGPRPTGRSRFLIAGTGEQYPGMAADLYATEPVVPGRAATTAAPCSSTGSAGWTRWRTMLRPRSAGRRGRLRPRLAARPEPPPAAADTGGATDRAPARHFRGRVRPGPAAALLGHPARACWPATASASTSPPASPGC